MSTTPTDDQPDLRHYTAALWRQWPVPIAVAVILTAVFALLPSSSSTLVTGKVALVDESGLAVSLGLPKEIGTRYSSPQALLAVARAEDFRLAVAKTLGFHASVATSAEDGPGTVTISSTSEDADRAAAIVSANLTELIKRRRELRASTTAAAIAANEERLATFQKRLTALDQTLSGLDDPRSALAAGLLAERESLLSDRTDVENMTAGFDQLDKLSVGGISLIEPSRLDVSSSKAKKAAYGFVFGGLIGVGVVLAMAFFDRRLRTRRDVERIAGTGALLGVLTRDGNDEGALAVAAAIAAIDGPTVRLVPAGPKVDAGAVADGLRTAAAGSVTLPTIAVASSAATAAAAGPAAGAAVVLVQAGSAREDDLAIALDRLHNAGVAVAGVVLTNLAGRRVASSVL